MNMAVLRRGDTQSLRIISIHITLHRLRHRVVFPVAKPVEPKSQLRKTVEGPQAYNETYLLQPRVYFIS